MQAAVAHIAAKAQGPDPSGGSDPFGSFGFAPANDPTANDAPAQNPASGVADAFTQALAAMMGVAAPAVAIAPHTQGGGAASQSVGSQSAGSQGVGAQTLEARNAQVPAIVQLPAGDAAAAAAALKNAVAQTTPQPGAQASANAAAGKAQTPQQATAPGARQTPAGLLTAFSATKLGESTNTNTPNVAPLANEPPAEPVPPLNAQSATAAILTAPVQTLAAKPATETAEKAQAKADSAEDSPAPAVAAAQKPQAPTPATDTASGEGEADLGGRHASEANAASQAPAQGSASADNTSFASALAQTGAPAQAAGPSTALAASAGAAIVSQIATQTIKSLDGKSTRFDIALEPAGLGQVNVKIQIDQTGQVSAAFSFDNPHAAAAAKSQAGQLQQALEQAGFNVGQGGLSFDVGGQGAGGARPDAGQNFASNGGLTAPEATPVAAAQAPTSNLRVRASGVDITV